MIHTAQLAINLTYSEGEYFKSLPDTTYRKPHDTFGAEFINYRFSGLGIREARLETFDTGPRLSVRINLNRLANDGQPSIAPLPPNKNELDKACSNLAGLLTDFVPSRNKEEWHLSRIDYTADIKTPYVKEYIKLFQRGDKPPLYEINRGRKDAIERKKKHQRMPKTHLPNSCTYSCQTAEITFYDKEAERIYNDRPAAEVAEARDTIRFEMRFRYGKIKKTSNTCSWSGNVISEAMTGGSRIADMAMRYIRICCRSGDYYDLATAKKIVRDSKEIHSRTKGKLNYILDLVNAKRSIWKARESYIESTGNADFNSLLVKLDKIGVNPVTIPEKWGISKLENLCDKFEAITQTWREA